MADNNVKCKAENPDGTRCKRNALSGSKYCSMHLYLDSLSKNEIRDKRNTRTVWVIAGISLILTIIAAILITKYVKPDYIEKSENLYYGPSKDDVYVYTLGKEAAQSAEQALSALETGNLSKAESLYAALTLIAPNDPILSYNFALTYSYQEKYKLAISAWRRTIVLDSANHMSYNNFGLALMHDDQIEAALIALQTAIRLDANDALAYANIGNLYDKMDSLDLALNAYRKSIAIQPDLHPVFLGLGISLIKAGYARDGIDTLRIFLTNTQLPMLKTEAYFHIGNAYSRIKKYDSALVAWYQCLGIDTGYYDARNNIGVAYLELKKYDSAVAIFANLARTYSDSAVVYNNLGFALIYADELDKAEVALRKALELKADLAQAYNGLGMIAGKRNDRARAIALFKSAIAHDSTIAAAYFNVGYEYGRMGAWDSAVYYLEHASRLQPGDTLTERLFNEAVMKWMMPHF